MKKLLLTAVALSLFSLSTADASANLSAKNVAVDSIQMMQRSLEGQKLIEQIQKKAAAHQDRVRNASRELTEAQEKIAKESLSQEEIRIKSEELMHKKKKLEREIADEEENLKYQVQNDQIVLRNKQLSVVAKMAEENKWEMVVEKNNPGLIFAANSIDITEEALKKVDIAFSAEQEKAMITTGKTETPKMTKIDASSLNAVIKKKSATPDNSKSA